MKKIFFSLTLALIGLSASAATAITFNGTTLQLNNDFTRTECGTAYKKNLQEVSGMACSRQTPGYLWMEGDEDNFLVVTKPDGTLAMKVTMTGLTSREDWEDLATGVYNGTNYVFVGAIGDNDKQYNDNYIIYYFEEPVITSGTKSIAVKYLKLGFPDNKAHNTEAIMYDNLTNKLYVIDKVYDGQCSVYYIPFNLSYGTGVQRLTYVCTLGISGEYDFQTVTAADITPSGNYVIIKNNIKSEDCEKVSKDAAYALIWDRQNTEDLSVTLARQPKQIAAYQLEKQGEAVAWYNDSIFYTTSDQKKDVAIYQYTRWNAKQPGQTGEEEGGNTPISTGDSTLCGMIIKADFVDKKSASITGAIGGTADVSLSDDGKLDRNKYFGITLSAGLFHAGDTVTITMSKAADLEHLIVYADKERQTVIYEDVAICGGTTIQFVLPVNTESIYLSRPDGSGWNPTISSIQVNRPAQSDTTALQSAVTRAATTKIMHNGHLYLRHNGRIFTMQGQKM